MRVDADAFKNAMKLRGFFVSEFLKYHGPTDSSAGVTLVSYAATYGYTDRSRPIPGKTLRSWIAMGNVPQWAVKSIVRYILNKGYVPESDQEIDALLVNVIVGLESPDLETLMQLKGIERLDEAELANSLQRIWHAK